jgi:serine/threonine protein kinase
MDSEQRDFRADPLLMRRLRVAAGLSVKEFTKRAKLDRGTVKKILAGEPVLLSSLRDAAKLAFNIESPLEVLHPDELVALGVQTDVPTPGQVLEWEIEQYLSGWTETTNGLQYQLVKLRHRFLDNRLARGKCYELRHLTGAERERIELYLHRHVDVCEQIGDHPNVAHNITAAAVAGLWWVIDRWEEGTALDKRIGNGPFSEYELKVVMTGIAEGLTALHKAGIIRRELTPASVLLRESNDRPVLTDMELAKIGDSGPTVAPEEWPDDPYRAPEVEGSAPISERADIYSWGRIFAHAALGSLPDRGNEDLSDVDLPKGVQEVVEQSLAINPSGRKTDLKKILKALKAWP